MLRSEPSFSVYSDSADGVREEDLIMGNDETLERTVTIGDKIDAAGSGEFSFAKQSDFLLIKEEDDEGGEGEDDEKVEGFNGIRNKGFGEEAERGKWFDGDGDLGIGGEEIKKREEDVFDGTRRLETAEKDEKREGFSGIGNLGFGEADARRKGFNGFGKLVIGEEETPDVGVEQGLDRIEQLGFEGEIERPVSPPMHLATGLGIDKFDFNSNAIVFDLPSFDDENCDEYCKKMLDDYPLHPLLLRNYAQFLEYKGDLHAAEDYYHRCTLVEPGDGENLANYAKLVWRLHRDQTKASHYFERAARASPEDSNVLAAYASFLWEIDDGDDDDDYDGEENHQGTEQFKPTGAEERNSSSAPAEMEDGETMCQYAKSFWDVHRDHDKALFYFKKAVQASPDDSNILAAYARFMWEADEYDEEEQEGLDQVPSSPLHETSVTAKNAQVVFKAS